MKVKGKFISHCGVPVDPCHYTAVGNVTFVCVDCVAIDCTIESLEGL